MVCFEKTTTENVIWADSAKKMQLACFTQMVRLGLWKMMGKVLAKYENNPHIRDEALKILSRGVKEHLLKGNKQVAFAAADDFQGVLPKESVLHGINSYLDELLCTSDWDACGDLRGHVIYFAREEFQSKHVLSKGLLLQGKSRNTMKSWHAGRVIYRNLRYEGGGVFRLEPIIINEEDFDYGENGSLEVITMDSIKINYGQKLSSSSSKKIFVRLKGSEKSTEKP